MYEKTLVIVKPDGVQRRMVGTLVDRFERAALKIHAMRFQKTTPEQSKKHYAEHVDKPFYPSLEKYITVGPVMVFVLGGDGAIAKVRQLVGATEPASALPGTIRGDYAHQPMERGSDRFLCNLIHASANADDAATEVALWFTADEIVDYERVDDMYTGM
jgi:nucleoside-diphosphate kinase